MKSIVENRKKKRDLYKQERQQRVAEVERVTGQAASAEAEENLPQTVSSPNSDVPSPASPAVLPPSGRPRKNRDTQMTILMNSKVKDNVRRYAFESRISVADFFEQLVTQYLKENGFWED